MADLVLTKQSLDRIDQILATLLTRSGAHTVLLIDKAGQLISFQGSMNQEKVASLAALTAANYGATTAIARLFGEKSSLFSSTRAKMRTSIFPMWETIS